MRRLATALMVGAVLAGCQDAELPTDVTHSEATPILSRTTGEGIPMSVRVEFGRDDVGSPFPPPEEHDASAHAFDKMYPRTVVIRRGGSVTFDMGTFHQVAIYEPGTTPDDIEVSEATLEDLLVPFPPFVLENFIINDPTGRIATGPFSFSPTTWESPAGTFDAPGRYLVICRVVPHFVGANMYAWIIVK